MLLYASRHFMDGSEYQIILHTFNIQIIAFEFIRPMWMQAQVQAEDSKNG